MSITINRPRKFTSKTTDNQYVKVPTPDGIERVMLDDSILEDWDHITTMTFDYESYTQATVDGKLVDKDWDRLECVDYSTTLREFGLAEHAFKLTQVGVTAAKSTAVDARKSAAAEDAI